MILLKIMWSACPENIRADITTAKSSFVSFINLLRYGNRYYLISVIFSEIVFPFATNLTK